MATKVSHSVGKFLTFAPDAAKNVETIIRKSFESEIEKFATQMRKGTAAPADIARVIQRVERFRRMVGRTSSMYLRYVFVNIDSVFSGRTPQLSNITSLYTGQVPFMVPRMTSDNKMLEAAGFTRKISPKLAMRWLRLSHKYIKKDPVSKNFWRKRGKLHRFFTESTKGRGMSTIINATVDYTQPPRRSHRDKWRVIVPIKLVYPDLGVLWNGYVLEPFVSGNVGKFPIHFIQSRTASRKADAKAKGLPKRQWRKGEDTSRETIRILTFLEQKRHKHGGRPFIKALSVEMGTELRKALRKL